MTQVSADLKARVNEKLDEVYAKCDQLFGRSFPRPTIGYDLRGRTAGTAHCSRNHIRLNAVLLNENQQAFIDRTVVHEIAHLIVDQVYPGASSHGTHWKTLMVTLGADPSRCHNYDVSNSQVYSVGRIEYSCGCSITHKISVRRHNKILRGAVYSCRQCKTILKPVDSHRAAPAVPPQQTVKPLTRGSKAHSAYNIFVERYFDASDKQRIIDMYIDELGMTPAGASTYFYNSKKRFEQEEWLRKNLLK